MSKQITAAELAEIVHTLLTAPESIGELDSAATFESFMTQIAEAVCNHCGGELAMPASYLDDTCYVGIRGNDSLPEGRTVWDAYDAEGSLFPDVEAGAPRDIFTELLGAKEITLGSTRADPARQELVVQRVLVANEILNRYPADYVITSERFNADDAFGECLVWLHSHFAIAAWEGRSLAEFLRTYAPAEDQPERRVLQYGTQAINDQGCHLAYVTLEQLRDATTLGETGWLLPDGCEVWLH